MDKLRKIFHHREHRGKQNMGINPDLFPHLFFSVSSVVNSLFGCGYAGLGFMAGK